MEKWDVHFSGTDKVFCIEAETNPQDEINDGAKWVRTGDGSMFNLRLVLAITRHVEPADVTTDASSVSAQPAGELVALIDRDEDRWVADGAGRFMFRGNALSRESIEREYGPVTEERAPVEPTPVKRPILRDGDGDIWVPLLNDDKYVLVDRGTKRTREQIERVFSSATEISAAEAGLADLDL
jgi:hypothetical protein